MTGLIDRTYFSELSKQDPADVCRRAMCHWDPSDRSYLLPVWGNSLRIVPHRLTIETMSNKKHQLDDYLLLFAIHYLLGAQAITLANKWISEMDVAGGATFFRGPHRIPTHLIADRFSDDIDGFNACCRRYEGRPVPMGDSAFAFDVTPRVPVAVLFWKGDDEFPAEAKILYDRTITDHIASDVIYALAAGICRQLGLA